MRMGWTKAVIMKIIPFSSIMEFQRETQRAVRGNSNAESAVWAVFAMCSAISVLLSLSQIAPVPSAAPKDSSVVLDQRNSQPIYPLQTT
jgi:hypothetical protein